MTGRERQNCMTASPKRVLITDLDNTLFDWVGLWYACFTAMLGKVVDILPPIQPTVRAPSQVRRRGAKPRRWRTAVECAVSAIWNRIEKGHAPISAHSPLS
jgi:hypothetical protein